MRKSPEIRQPEETPRPAGRDIIKVDGRWAQSFGSGGSIIRWLDTGEEQTINLDDYRLVTKHNKHIALLEKLNLASFTDEEVNRIKWSDEIEYEPFLNRQVKVFGEYEKK